MIRAVFDTNLLVSAFLTRHQPGGVSNELLRFARERSIELYLSADIVAETLATLTRNPRAQANYHYTPQTAEQFCSDLLDVAIIVNDPAPVVGAVARDPDDDKIVASAAAASAEYLVTHRRHPNSLPTYQPL